MNFITVARFSRRSLASWHERVLWLYIPAASNYSVYESRLLICSHLRINSCPRQLLRFIQILVNIFTDLIKSLVKHWLVKWCRDLTNLLPMCEGQMLSATTSCCDRPEQLLLWKCTQLPLHSKCVGNSHPRTAVAGCSALLHPSWDCTARHLASLMPVSAHPLFYSFSGVCPQGKVLQVIAYLTHF